MRHVLFAETSKGSHFMTSRARPKASVELGLGADSSPRYSLQPAVRPEKAAIVLQGPIWSAENFSLETVRIYRRHMPDCRLVLSTWKDAPQTDLDRIAKEGVDIVLNDKPATPGPYNVNMQIVSSSGGMRRAAELGVEWVIKSRTDQRLYQPTIMSSLISLAQLFPPLGAAATTQKYRVFGMAGGTFKFAPYHLSDQTVFGHIDDMLSYWSPPLRESPLPEDFPTDPLRLFLEVPIGKFCRYAAAETYFASQFLLRQGRSLEWTISDSWAALRDHFGVVDQMSSDIYWVKGQHYTMRDVMGSYAALSNIGELGFLEWVQLVAGALSPETAGAYERVLDECITPFDPGYP
ncbi:WavE lipopolysaccharide synthesis [Erythrobacter litoralis]|uniref:WavE lipopolysaccharide synthesis n=1 Tax=Erythrobacter litoralis TaxID=39960 RepID=A0A074MVM3_9SPHN|nr:WavE lipopolysaccharide synthesis family protein [Erythrobacter litoralis]AOL22393.1 WavE lipopolysaccharide synthesis [Erythrobacter litoralis]KEO99061.1 hypothetical protein EH32_08135 [Erythrobacter litoralis]